MKKFYIAHNFGNRQMIRKWELRMESKYNIILNNPFYDRVRNDVQKLDELKDGSARQKLKIQSRDVDIIVDGDLDMIRKGDGLVAYLEPSKNFSTMIGTPMEIFYAARVLHIPVYVITKKFSYHPWIRKYATQIFPHRTAFERFIKEEFGLRQGL